MNSVYIHPAYLDPCLSSACLIKEEASHERENIVWIFDSYYKGGVEQGREASNKRASLIPSFSTSTTRALMPTLI
ncbi:Uncharacterised protein [uncultured archaeon]|nr:Uncharacterised protein [uncultured archaeon]